MFFGKKNSLAIKIHQYIYLHISQEIHQYIYISTLDNAETNLELKRVLGK